MVSLETLAVLVDRESAVISFYRALFEEFGDVLRAHTRLRLGHFFFNAIGAWWFDSVTVAVRRLVDRSRKSISLYRLVSRLLNSSDVWATIPGIPNPEDIRSDLVKINAVSHRAREIADRMVAHRDERGIDDSATAWRGDLYAALDALQPILDRYVSLFVAEADRAVYLYYADWANELLTFPWKSDDNPTDFPTFTGARLVTRRQADLMIERWNKLGYSTLT